MARGAENSNHSQSSTVHKTLERNSAAGLNIRRSGPLENARSRRSHAKIEGMRLANDEWSVVRCQWSVVRCIESGSRGRLGYFPNAESPLGHPKTTLRVPGRRSVPEYSRLALSSAKRTTDH